VVGVTGVVTLRLGRRRQRRPVPAEDAGEEIEAFIEPPSGATGRSPLAPSVALGLAVGVFAVSFGVLAVATGLSVAQTCAMSLLVFTGASQFAVVGVIGTGGSPAAALASALLLAARNSAYGLVLAPVIRGRLPRRLLAAQIVIDESTAMALAQPDRGRRELAFWTSGLSVFVFWNIGTLIGAFGGGVIGDPATLGLDAAFPAGFVALIVPHLHRMEGRVVAAMGATIALVLVPLTPAGIPVLAAGTAALVGLRAPRGDGTGVADRTGQ
jgi:4-azaleucine resistance transporter AzlC